MTRKNLLCFVSVFALSFVLVACGNNNRTAETSATKTSSAETSSVADETEAVTETMKPEESAEDVSGEPTEEQETTETETAQTDADGAAQTNANGGSVLIAYFSHTGNTEKVVRTIAEYTGGTLAEIERAEEYGDLQEEAKVEIEDGVHPEITVSVDNIDAYDTIFVGYPIWWDEAPAMIATFLAENDFSGKTIIPFCTSSSDDIGNSLHIFSELCPDAEIAEGLTANDPDDIEPWIQGLGLME